MITPVILPQLGDTMNEGTLTRWFKREGERVEKGEPLFELLTDKASMEVESTVSGFLRAVMHHENETVPTGEILAYLTTAADEPLQVIRSEEKEHHADVARVKRAISPRARRLAEEKGVDLAQVIASRPGGRVVEADVIKFLEQRQLIPSVPNPPTIPSAPSPSSAESAEQIVPLTGVRKVIAERMSASARAVARVTLTTEADATRLVEMREEINARVRESEFSYTEFFVLLAAKALLKFPYMNSTFEPDGIHPHAAVHIGVAVDTERGLLVPVLRNVQQKGMGEIAKELRERSEQTQMGKIAPYNLRGGTFTITNLGAYEVDAFTPIINVPETAILGIGRITLKPANYQQQLRLRHMVTLSLSFDHRVVDGAPAARFLQEVKRLVETPGLMLV